MKLDEATINSTALHMIKDIVDSMVDCCDERLDRESAIAIAEIRGISILADELKEVLEG